MGRRRGGAGIAAALLFKMLGPPLPLPTHRSPRILRMRSHNTKASANMQKQGRWEGIAVLSETTVNSVAAPEVIFLEHNKPISCEY